MSEEIHVSVFLSNRPALAARISANERLRILLDCPEWCVNSPHLQLLAVGSDKWQHPSGSAFVEVWSAMYQLFDQTPSNATQRFHYRASCSATTLMAPG